MFYPAFAHALVAVSLFLSAAMVAPSVSIAGASPLSFTEEEIAANRTNAKQISEVAAQCLNRTWDFHNRFYNQRGYSKYYGNRKPEHKTVDSRKQVLLNLLPALNARVSRGDRAAIDELNKREHELEATSCIGLSLKCLGEGFHAVGMDETWHKIHEWLGRKDAEGSPMFYGTDLQKALVDLGWKSLYWNPDTTMNEEWDRLEQELNPVQDGKKWNPVWGGHVYRWSLVKRKQDYYGIPVQDIQTLVNFGIKTPEDFKKVPFFVGTAHSGYHVFPGFKGQVIEAHSMRNLNSHHNLEVGAFNPLFQEVNGIPNGNGAPKWTPSEHYRSGVIVVPPGFIADKPFQEPPKAVGTPPNGTPRPEPVALGTPTGGQSNGSQSGGLNPYRDLPPQWPDLFPSRRRDRFFPPWFR